MTFTVTPLSVLQRLVQCEQTKAVLWRAYVILQILCVKRANKAVAIDSIVISHIYINTYLLEDTDSE